MILILLTILFYVLIGIGSILIKKSINEGGEDKIRSLKSRYFIFGFLFIIISIIGVKICLYYMDLSVQYPLSIASNVRLITPVPELYTSQQPKAPQLH